MPIVDSYGSAPAEASLVGVEAPQGVIVCGMSQAGKTTARDMIAEAWCDIRPSTEVLPFTNSNGFRGLTYVVLEHFGQAAEAQVDESAFAGLLNSYVAEADMPVVLSDLYERPLPPEQLRCPAVNSVVAVTAETLHVRPQVTEAGADFLAKILVDPLMYGYPKTPDLVILDGRNNQELQEKFTRAGVRGLGTIVLTCPEEVVVTRVSQQIDLLIRRNQKDRQNPIAPMTLPEDFKITHLVDDIIKRRNAARLLEEAGAEATANQEAAVVIRTDHITLEEEARAMGPILRGMLSELG